jgi:hypothetical protein
MRFTPTNAPTLFDLAVAAATVHHDSLRYRLFKRQFFWFVDMLLQVLARTYQTVDSKDGNLLKTTTTRCRYRKEGSPKSDMLLDREQPVYTRVFGECDVGV